MSETTGVISKIKVGNNLYNISDNEAREGLEALKVLKTLTISATSTIASETIQMIGAVIAVEDYMGTEIRRAIYNGTPVQFALPYGQMYRINVISKLLTISGLQFFNPTPSPAEGTLLENTICNISYANVGSMRSLSDAVEFIRTGVDEDTARSILIGEEGALHNFETSIDLINPDTGGAINMPIVAEEVYQAEDELGRFHTAIKWMFKYTFTDRAWDYYEQEECTDPSETFTTNYRYFTATSGGIGDKGFTQISDYTVGQNISDYAAAKNVHVFKNGLTNNSGNLAADTSILRYGCNVYHLSNIDKWLNGTGKNWFVPSHTGDTCPYSSDWGFMSWIKPQDMAYIQKVYYGVYERSGFELPGNKLCRYFALPSGTNIAGSCNENEGNVFLRWKEKNGGVISNADNSNRTITSISAPTSTQYMWTLSPYRWYSNYAWGLVASGLIYGGGGVRNSNGVAPDFTTY